ncbi:MAG: methyltransferase domain-containing protein [Flavitalea sp.]
MAWNPDTYTQFKNERFAPFYTLLELIDKKPALKVVDLGCGTGEQASELGKLLPGSEILGIDASGEMLNASKEFEKPGLGFRQMSIESYLKEAPKHDLVFSNAALQWVPDHEWLLPAIIKTINKGGQFVCQVPAQHTNVGNRLINEVAAREPFASKLQNWSRVSSVLPVERYASIMFENHGTRITAMEKIFPLVLESPAAVYSWLKGTTLIPYFERLPEDLHAKFAEEIEKDLRIYFDRQPVFYPFKRILFCATF